MRIVVYRLDSTLRVNYENKSHDMFQEIFKSNYVFVAAQQFLNFRNQFFLFNKQKPVQKQLLTEYENVLKTNSYCSQNKELNIVQLL